MEQMKKNLKVPSQTVINQQNGFSIKLDFMCFWRERKELSFYLFKYMQEAYGYKNAKEGLKILSKNVKMLNSSDCTLD